MEARVQAALAVESPTRRSLEYKHLAGLELCFKGQVEDLEKKVSEKKMQWQKEQPAEASDAADGGKKEQEPEELVKVEQMKRTAAEETLNEKVEQMKRTAAPEELVKLEIMEKLLQSLQAVQRNEGSARQVLQRCADKLTYIETRAMEANFNFLEVCRMSRAEQGALDVILQANDAEDKAVEDLLQTALQKHPGLEPTVNIYKAAYMERRDISTAVSVSNSWRERLRIEWMGYWSCIEKPLIPTAFLHYQETKVVLFLEEWVKLQKKTEELILAAAESDEEQSWEALQTIWKMRFPALEKPGAWVKHDFWAGLKYLLHAHWHCQSAP